MDMRANELGKVLLRFFHVGENGVVSCQVDFGGREEVNKEFSDGDGEPISISSAARSQESMNSFRRRVGVSSIHACSPRNAERPLSQTATRAHVVNKNASLRVRVESTYAGACCTIGPGYNHGRPRLSKTGYRDSLELSIATTIIAYVFSAASFAGGASMSHLCAYYYECIPVLARKGAKWNALFSAVCARELHLKEPVVANGNGVIVYGRNQQGNQDRICRRCPRVSTNVESGTNREQRYVMHEETLTVICTDPYRAHCRALWRVLDCGVAIGHVRRDDPGLGGACPEPLLEFRGGQMRTNGFENGTHPGHEIFKTPGICDPCSVLNAQAQRSSTSVAHTPPHISRLLCSIISSSDSESGLREGDSKQGQMLKYQALLPHPLSPTLAKYLLHTLLFSGAVASLSKAREGVNKLLRFSGITDQHLANFNITPHSRVELDLKRAYEKRAEMTRLLGHEKLWSSTNFYRHLEVLQNLVPNVNEESARIWIDAFFFRTSAMVPCNKRMVLSVEQVVHQTVVGPLSSKTLSGYIDYTAVIADNYLAKAKARTSALRGALTDGNTWIFLILVVNPDGNGATFRRSAPIEFRQWGMPSQQILKPWPDVLTGILVQWTEQGGRGTAVRYRKGGGVFM
ncbi:hypothetical protein EDB92DRAFT_2109525 [Lactarius akahatsu]|uniref:Uncharacterized protein n=1 Tax=Lactarius akahatsu TaxID=416441 RepID=A0AAD4L7R5_9AGAM|nr:hypothetical protein EDB92DRAFT_2109525 [Lactarius akahatsu]